MVHLSDMYAILVLGLGSARLTRIITTDTITDKLRARVVRRYHTGWPTQLIHCPWCVGWWISAALVLVASALGALSGVAVTLLSIPATAQLAAWVRQLSDKE